MKREKSLEVLTIRVPPSWRMAIEKIAESETRTMTNVIKQFIEQGLKKKEDGGERG